MDFFQLGIPQEAYQSIELGLFSMLDFIAVLAACFIIDNDCARSSPNPDKGVDFKSPPGSGSPQLTDCQSWSKARLQGYRRMRKCCHSGRRVSAQSGPALLLHRLDHPCRPSAKHSAACPAGAVHVFDPGAGYLAWTLRAAFADGDAHTKRFTRPS